MNSVKKKVLILFKEYGIRVWDHVKEYKQYHITPDLELAYENFRYYIFLKDIIRTKQITMWCL